MSMTTEPTTSQAIAGGSRLRWAWARPVGGLRRLRAGSRNRVKPPVGASERLMRLIDRASEAKPIEALARLVIAAWLSYLAGALRRAKRIERAAPDHEARLEAEKRRSEIESVLRDIEWQRLCGKA